jgi:hypothetical protein
MDVTPAALAPENNPSVPNGWAPESVWVRWKRVKFVHMPGIEPRFLKLPVHSHFQDSRTTKVITAMFAETLGKQRHGLKPQQASRHRRPSAEVSGQEISCSSSFIFPVLFVCKTIPLAGRTWFKVDTRKKKKSSGLRPVLYYSTDSPRFAMGFRSWRNCRKNPCKMNLSVQCKSGGSDWVTF